MVKTGKPGMLQSMESQRVGHDLVTEQPFSFGIKMVDALNNKTYTRVKSTFFLSAQPAGS